MIANQICKDKGTTWVYQKCNITLILTQNQCNSPYQQTEKEKLYNHLNKQFRRERTAFPTNNTGTTRHPYSKVTLDPDPHLTQNSKEIIELSIKPKTYKTSRKEYKRKHL